MQSTQQQRQASQVLLTALSGNTTDYNSVVVRSPFVACGRVPQLCAGVPAFTSLSPAYVTSLCGLPRPVITTKSSQFTHRLAQIRVRCAATIVVAARSLVSLHRRLNAHHHQHTLKIRKAPKSNGTAAQSTKAALTQPNVNALRSAHIHLEPSPTPLAPIQSTAASGSTLVSVDTEAFKPFALKRRWYCPYRLKGLPCVHRKKNGLQPGEFNSSQALCQHTDKAHDGGKQIVTPIEADQLPESPQRPTTGMLRATDEACCADEPQRLEADKHFEICDRTTAFTRIGDSQGMYAPPRPVAVHSVAT